MANAFLTHSMIAERALFDLTNNLVMAGKVYKGYNSEFATAIGGYQRGSSVTIHLPNKFRTKSGAAIDKVQTVENSTSVTVDQQKHVALDFTETELTLSIADFSRKYIAPATIALANVVDSDGFDEYVNVYNLVGTPGTTPSTFRVLADIAERMDNEAVPADRVAIWSPKAAWSLADGELKSIFHQQIVQTMVRRGFMGRFANTEHFMDQNGATHTVGTWDTGSTGVMNGATAEGATSLVTNGWANGTTVLKQGDVITIAAVVGVNPVSGKAWEGDVLRQFVVTSDVISDGSGNATIPISPKIYSSAALEDVLPYQTIVTLPQNGAAITVVTGAEGTAHLQNLAFHPDCFALTMVPFKKPKSAGSSIMWGQASDKDLGLSITVATAFDIDTYSEATRLDILYGWDTIRPELGVRITG